MNKVAVKSEYGGYLFGTLRRKGKNKSLVFLKETWEEVVVNNTDIYQSKEIEMSKEKIIDVLLGNVSFEEAEIYSYNQLLRLDEKVTLNINELEKAFKYLLTLNDKEQWFRVFSFYVDYNKDDFLDLEEIESIAVTQKTLEAVCNKEHEELNEYISGIFVKRRLPLEERYLNKEEKKSILKLAFDLEKEYGDELNELLYSFLIDSEFDHDLEVIYIRAYSYYGGNSFCPCDYKKAEENLLILYKNGDTFAANSLGYIYYYGRVNDGVPQYDLAYSYFSIAAFANETEAIIKISDMFKNGYHVDKNYKVAFTMLEKIYNEQLDLLEHGKNNKFADIALRIGTMHENGYHVEKIYEQTIKNYLLAKVAITLREKHYPHFGDLSVKKAIDKSLERIDYLKFRWSNIENKEYIITGYCTNNNYVTNLKINKRNETVIELHNYNTNKKLMIDLNNKNAYFSNRLAIVINSKYKLPFETDDSLNLMVYDNLLLMENHENLCAVPLKDIKIKLYDKIIKRPISFNANIND